MISDKLFLTKSDNQLIVPHPEEVNLIDEVNGVFEFYEALAEENSTTLYCPGTGVISGGCLMLCRAISNLLSNACVIPRRGTRDVRIDSSEDSAVKLSMTNHGKGIYPLSRPPKILSIGTSTAVAALVP